MVLQKYKVDIIISDLVFIRLGPFLRMIYVSYYIRFMSLKFSNYHSPIISPEPCIIIISTDTVSNFDFDSSTFSENVSV